MPATKKKPPKWLGATVTYEGFPLALRVRPQVDTDANKAAYPKLVCVTHKLAHVRQNGIPESDYNHGLLDFDLAIINAIQVEDNGLVVLIETFAGCRNYYGYVKPRARLTEPIRALKKRFPEHTIA